MKFKSILFIVPLFLFCASANAYVNRNVAHVRVLNKAAGKVYSVSVPVGKSAEFEKLNMTVRACKQTDPFAAEDFFMFIEISTGDQGKIFSGWMSRNEPGDNPLQNADYDVWIASCE